MSRFLSKSIIFAAFSGLFFGGANAVSYNMAAVPTARPSVAQAASLRMPSMTGNIIGSNTGSGSSSTTTLTAAEKDKICIDSYTSCLYGSDACGSSFEECTNNTLFFGKKARCASTLLTCSPNATKILFGTTSQTELAKRSTTETDSNGDYLYVYPTEGSLLGGLIGGAAISNRLNTQDCVKRYTNCLKKEDVCGPDFELCTSNDEFKKQKIFCQSTLERCQTDGRLELWGTSNTAGDPVKPGRIAIMIEEGANLAGVNAVAACYKVADQCILNACGKNPYRCKEGSLHSLVNAAGETFVGDPNSSGIVFEDDQGAVNRSEISGYIKNECLDTIGANKFCYATFLSPTGSLPTAAQQKDPDNHAEIFSEAFRARFNDGMRSKIDTLVERFDKATKQKCQDTIVSCAMRSCGEGSGVACYASAFAKTNTVLGVANPETLKTIKFGCEHVVNSDAFCKYSGATFNATGNWDWVSGSLFDVLFTDPNDMTSSKPDAVGAVASLNAKLSASYSEVALEAMRKQCTGIAQSCVKSMCGTDYTNCYRNRTDVASSIGATDPDGKNTKAGGVLDRAIVIGLCLNTVKNNEVCNNHIAAEVAKRENGTTSSDIWGGATNSRGGWLDATGATYSETSQGMVYEYDEDGNQLCLNTNGDTGICGSDDFKTKIQTEQKLWVRDEVAKQIFVELIHDLEAEAQAKYMAKITRQQNMCMSSNNGGIMGNKDMASTFMWAKLNSTKVPSNYAVKGLNANQFKASNDLFGSFCRVRVTLQSDDRKIQDAIVNNAKIKQSAIAYFAAGDAFTCGAWIPQDALEEVSKVVYDEKYRSQSAKNERTWWPIVGSVLGAVGGGWAGNAIAGKLNDGGLSGLISGNASGQKKITSDQYAQAKTELNNCQTRGKIAMDNLDKCGDNDSAILYDMPLVTVKALRGFYSEIRVPNYECVPGSGVDMDAKVFGQDGMVRRVSSGQFASQANPVVGQEGGKDVVVDMKALDAKFDAIIATLTGFGMTEYATTANNAKVLAASGNLTESATALKTINLTLTDADKKAACPTSSCTKPAGVNETGIITWYDLLIGSELSVTAGDNVEKSDAAKDYANKSKTAFEQGDLTTAKINLAAVNGAMDSYQTWKGGFPKAKWYIASIENVLGIASAKQEAQAEVSKLTKDLEALAAAQTTPVAMSYSRDTLSVYALTAGVPLSHARADLQAKIDECTTANEILENRENESRKAEKTKLIGTGVGAALGGVGGYFLTAKIVQSSQKANAEGAQKQWLDEVGKHIRCYIGADEVGEFGDIISTSLE